MSFWDFLWLLLLSYLFVAYLMVFFSVLTDLFRDRDTGGVAKAVWIIFLIVTPLLSVVVYLIARGRGMAERATDSALRAKEAQESYVREVAGTSPAQQVAEAKALLDDQVISPQEFEQLKTKALAG
ncbi:PLDc N-terminal domain-containing protein [Aquipuribacter sp. MA13-6]|uniref:PLDc N-terminal domain-containing protein n=1 Tax=unclassified Aquipuribacter TaxID=2635084 RepID=UPI003EEB254E